MEFAPEIHNTAISSMAYFFLRQVHCGDYPEEFETEMHMLIHALEHKDANIEHCELFYSSLYQELVDGAYLDDPDHFLQRVGRELIRIDTEGSFATKGEFTQRVYQIILAAREEIERRQHNESCQD